MAYTVDQLSTFFKNANAGTGPSSAQVLSLQALANQNAAGSLSNDQAFAATVNLASDTTTAVSVETYQFFLGYAPNQAGLAALNAAYVGTGAQASLNAENRFIAQSISLALQNTDAKTKFTNSYGSLSILDTVKAAYDIIIGNTTAVAAGVNLDNAYKFFTDQQTYFTNFVKQVMPTASAADQALAVKAAIVGEIIYQATKYNDGAGLGSYAVASTNLIKDLADDGALTANNPTGGIDLFAAYGPGGVGQTYTLTAGIDAPQNTSGNDIYVGNTAAGALALTTLDTIDGGQGNDTLNLSVVGAVDTTLAVSAKITSIETVNIVSTGAVTADTTTWTGTTALNVNGAIGAIDVDAAATTAIKVVAASGAAGVAVDGGSTVNVTASNVSASATTVIGANTAAAGDITASVAVAASGTGGAVSATTKGGTSISLTQTKGAGATAGAANAIDGAAAAGKLGTVTTVKLDGNNGGSVTSNALTSLSLANNVGTTTITNNYGTGNATTTLALALNAAGGTLTDANGVYSTINITTSGKASSVTLVDAGLKTLSTAGDQKLTLGTVPATVTAYTGSGTGSLSATFGAALKTYASTATGGDTVTLNNTALTTASFGGGNDTVTINGVLATTTIDLGAGDDKLVFTVAPTAGATLSGGAGTDAISVTNAIWTTIAGTFVAADVAKITGFETLSISDSGTAGSATYNLGVLPGLTNLTLETGVQAGQNISVTNFVSGQTITVGGTNTTGTVTAVVGGAATGTADVVNLVGNTAIVQDNDAIVDTTVNTVRLIAVDVETVNFKSTGTLSTAVTTGNATDVASNTLVIGNTDTALTTVNITGDQNVSFTSDAAFTKLATVNASGLTGVAVAAIKEVFTATFGVTVDADTITFDGIGYVATAAQTAIQNAAGFVTFYNGQAGAHWVAAANGDGTVTFTQKTAGVTTDVVTGDFVITSGGAGADTTVTAAAPSVQGSAAVSAGAVIDVSAAASTSAAITVTGSVGGDTITVATKALVTGNGGNDTFVITAPATGNSYSTIGDANKSDVIKVAAATSFVATAITQASTAVFQDYLDAATSGAAGKMSWFVYGSDTYVVVDNSGSATFQNGTDIVVKLTGTANDLSKGTFSAGAHTLTLG